MNLIALDLSTKPGWACFENGALKDYGTLFPNAKKDDPIYGKYPFNYFKFADEVVGKVFEIIDTYHGGKCGFHHVVVEETTTSKNNYSQKILEFIHCLFIDGLRGRGVDVSYVRTGVWRNIVGAQQTNEERNWNAKIARIKKKTGKKLAKIDGKVVRKLDRKDYALRSFKEHFGKELPREMEDACEAALIGLAFLRGCPVCDGTTDGGTL